MSVVVAVAGNSVVVWFELSVRKLFNLDHKSKEVDVKSCFCSWLIGVLVTVDAGGGKESNEKWSRNFKFGNELRKTVLKRNWKKIC